MGFSRLKYVSRTVLDNGIILYATIPNLGPSELHGPLDKEIQLAVFERFRTDRPYVVSFVDTNSFDVLHDLSSKDLAHVRSLPRIPTVHRDGQTGFATYVERGDLSPLTPGFEEGSLLFLPDPPPVPLPTYPDYVVILNGVSVWRTDELLKFETIDPKVMVLFDDLPKYVQGG